MKASARYALHRRDVGFERAIDLLQIRNITTGFDDDNFALPGEPGGSLNGAIDVAVPVPITGDKIHISINHDTAIMDFDGAARKIEALLHRDIAWVFEGFMVRDERVQPNDLLAMAQGLKVVCFNYASGLFGRKLMAVKENNLKTTYRTSSWLFTNERHTYERSGKDEGMSGRLHPRSALIYRAKASVMGENEDNDGRKRGLTGGKQVIGVADSVHATDPTGAFL